MERPKIVMQESDQYPDEVAIAMSLVPRFLEKNQKEANLIIEVDETPEFMNLSKDEKKYFFIFLVDRTGSMK